MSTNGDLNFIDLYDLLTFSSINWVCGHIYVPARIHLNKNSQKHRFHTKCVFILNEINKQNKIPLQVQVFLLPFCQQLPCN